MCNRQFDKNHDSFRNSVDGIRSRRMHVRTQTYSLSSLDNDTGVIRTCIFKKDTKCHKLPKKYGQCAKVNKTKTTKDIAFLSTESDRGGKTAPPKLFGL
jgi:hypothetical protein